MSLPYPCASCLSPSSQPAPPCRIPFPYDTALLQKSREKRLTSSFLLSYVPDFAAASALDVSLSASVPGRIMHLTNPSRAEMADLMPLFARELNLTLTTPSAWFNKLVALGEKLGDERGPQMVPALRLLPFFAEMTGGSLDKAGEAERAPTPIPVMPVRKTLDASATLRSCPAVGADNVARWVSFWRKEGLLA